MKTTIKHVANIPFYANAIETLRKYYETYAKGVEVTTNDRLVTFVIYGETSADLTAYGVAHDLIMAGQTL